MRRTIVIFMIGCAIPILVVGCGGGDASSDGDGAVAQNEGGDAGMPPGDSGGSGPGYDEGMADGSGGGEDGPMGEYGDGEDGSGEDGAYAGQEGDYAGGEGDPGGSGAGLGSDDGPMPGEGGYTGGPPGSEGAGYGPMPGEGGYTGGPPGSEGAGLGPMPGEGAYSGGPPGSEGAGRPPGESDPMGEDGAGYGQAGVAPGAPGAPGGYGSGEGGEGVAGGYGPASGGRAAPPTGFDGAAKVAFQAGRETEAFKYLYAHALSSAEGGANLLTSIQWVTGLKRPALAVRFGAGVALKSPPNISDVKPIGSTQQLPQRGARGQRGGGGGDDFGGGGEGFGGGPAPGGPGGFGGEGGGGDLFGGGGARSGGLIAKYAGDLGSNMVKAFQERVNRGAFGAVLKDAPKAGRGRGGFQGGDGGYAGGEGFGADPAGPGEAPGLSAGPGAPGSDGGFAGEGGGYGGGDGGGFGDGRASGIEDARGMTILGVGPERELVNKAKKEGLDVLFLFEVSVKVNPKTRLVTNDTKVVLIDVAKGGRIHTGKLLNNFKVQKARSESKEDGISKEIDKLFEFIDANLTMSPPPSILNSGHITKRVASLVSTKPDDILPVLTEIRFWHRRNLLDDEGLTAAFSQMLSPEIGEQLATGSEDERKAIVKRWLPASDG